MFFCAFAIVVFAVWSWPFLAIATFVLVGLVYVSKLRVVALAKSVAPILLMLVVVSFLNVFVIQDGNVLARFWIWRFTDVGLERSLYYSARLVLVLLAGALLLAVTSPMQLTEAMAKLFAPLQKIGVPVSQLALVLSLAIRFVPVIAQEATSIATAQRLRGAHLSHGSLAQRVNAACALVLPIVVGVIRHAENLAMALLAKSYVAGAARTPWDYDGFLKRKDDLLRNSE